MTAEKICNFQYLSNMVGGNQSVMIEIMNVFVKQIPEELKSINDAILINDYETIRSFAHTMKSSVSIVDIAVLKPVLQQMEDLAANAGNIEKIKELYTTLSTLCNRAIREIEEVKTGYV